MEKLILSPRLSLIASLAGKCGCVADVGTDHGYVPVWLLLHGLADRAVATDINAAPLSRAAAVAKQYAVTDRLKLLLCDGLAAVEPGEADTVIIAGMGGETMLSILAAAPWTRSGARLILQPQTKQSLLRRWLVENGYKISGEHLIRDGGKIYNVLTASGGSASPQSRAALHAGEAALHGDKALLREYLALEISKLEDISKKLSLSQRGGDERRLEEYGEIIAGMKKMLEEEE